MGVGEKQIMAALDDVVQSVRSTDSTVQSTWREFKPRIIRKFFRDGLVSAAADCKSDNNDDKIASIYTNSNANDDDGSGFGGDEVELVGKSFSGDNSPFVWDVEVLKSHLHFQLNKHYFTILNAFYRHTYAQTLRMGPSVGPG